MRKRTLNDDARDVLAPNLVRALRQAMLETMHPICTIGPHIEHPPARAAGSNSSRFRVRSRGTREVLRALSTSDRHDSAGTKRVAAGRRIIIHRRRRPICTAFLHALAPLVEGADGNLADQAAAAAIALLDGHQLLELATRREFMDIKIIRARDPHTHDVVVLSFAELLVRSRQRSLFRRGPNVESHLSKVVAALPDVDPLVVEATSDRLSEEGEQGGHTLTNTPNKEVLSALINATSRFGHPAARAQMIGLLSSPEGADELAALRRLCAGDWHAGAPNTTLWNQDRLPAETEKLIAWILDQRRNEFLVPSPIMTGLSPMMRNTIGIKDLDTAGLERLIEDSIDTLVELDLSETERKALLKSGLGQDLLRRLPIHDRSDDTIGSAEGLFREDGGWPIPDRLQHLVVTVILFDEPEIRLAQKRIVPAWSTQTQIETALCQPEPHRFQGEILDAIFESYRHGVALPPVLFEPLRTKPWLAANDIPVAPRQLLVLPSAVDEAAHELAGASPYISLGRLSNHIRMHPGFPYLKQDLIPNRRSSLAALAQMIADAGLQGRLGATEDYPLCSFIELAKKGADLKLPGWPLLAAVLASTDGHTDLRSVVISFREVSNTEPKVAGQHLDALADVAIRDAAYREAAKQAYRHGFEAVAKWPTDVRQRVFGRTRVPTKSGGWGSGTEVLIEDNGVAPPHVLAREYSSILPKENDAVRGGEVDASGDANDEQFGIDELRTKSVAQHREFLRDWRGRIPEGLVAVYLDIIGRHNPSLHRYRKEWSRDANVDRDLDTLRCHMPALFLLKKIRGRLIEVISLSGDRFNAPLDDHTPMAITVKQKYKIWPGEERRTQIFTLQVRTTAYDLPSLGDRVQEFRKFIEITVAKCLSDNAMSALCRILDRVAHVDQVTLEDTQSLLHDRLPTLLAALKLPARSNALYALRKFEAEEVRASDEIRVRLKEELWQSIREPAAAREVLAAVRGQIVDQGYGLHRVLFELFQNADDAYVQSEPETADASLRVDFGSTADRRLRIVHWGRPINYLGSNVEVGRSLGYERDLLNMLVMNFSEKRPEENVTGKFGLGFKCVHLLSDSVGVASGFVALRTVGGILPEQWLDGLRLVDELTRTNGGRATVIDVPYTTDEMANGGKRTEQAFRDAMPWLPALARKIRRIEVLGSAPATISCMVSGLPRNCGLRVVSIKDTRSRTQRALRFDLGDGYTLLLKVGAEGPECFEPAVKRVWNLAPLEEELSSGWVLNGPFPVDPGRGRLAGSIEGRQEQFVTLGRALGERLVSLHDLVERDWESLAGTLDLNVADNDARLQYWSRLFDVMGRDLDHYLARCLHAVDRGYGRLVAERPVAPTRLPVPFDALVRASSIEWVTDGALAANCVLQATRHWSSSGQLVGRVVGPEVAMLMRKLGFDRIRPISLSELLRMEMGNDKQIDVSIGTRIGQVITPDNVENEPRLQERQQILDIAKQANFLAQDGEWSPVHALSSRYRNDEEETLLCGFAPDTALLHEDYRAESLKFFEVARRQSGYGPVPALLRKWVMGAANDEDRQRAALRYLVHGRQGPALAQLVRDGPRTWMADVPARFLTDPLLEGWTDQERKQLAIELDPAQVKVDPPRRPPPLPREVSSILNKVHDWWMAERQQERPRYAKSVYPEEFCAVGLAGVDGGIDRTAWFTMFALACFRSFGRPRDGTHRAFIHSGWQQGWWDELAQSEPPDSVQPWLARLNRWSAPDRSDETFHQWQSTLVDLYTIARGMNVYVELIRKFPGFVEKHGVASLDVILRPRESRLAQELDLDDAAPIERALGIRANWLIRELSRNNVYEPNEARHMSPYCWAPTPSVRKFLMALDLDLGSTAAQHKHASPRIHKFVTCHIGADRASFGGDFDLPLQIVTRKRLRKRLNQWFEEEGRDAPVFGNESEDREDYE